MGCGGSKEEETSRATDGGSKSVGFKEGETAAAAARATVNEEKDLHREFKTAEGTKMPEKLEAVIKAFFDKMDLDGDGKVTKEEAEKHWGKNFAKINAKSMFNEVDEDGNAEVTWDEFLAFWQNVVASGYSEEDLEEEVQMMIEGGSWVDFNDGRTT